VAYDCIVEKRQTNVVHAAQRSDAIVRSLFPEAVRDRLYENAIKKEEQRQNAKNQWNQAELTEKGKLPNILDHVQTDEAAGNGADPIADFFPNCTILFSDIAGFTAWSSEREPAQVFLLLETLYRSMDRVAKKLKVFKVETVGDCVRA